MNNSGRRSTSRPTSPSPHPRKTLNGGSETHRSSATVAESPISKLKRVSPSNSALPDLVSSQHQHLGTHGLLLAGHRSKLSDMTHETIFFLDNKLIFGLDPKSEEDSRALILYKKIKGDQLSQLAGSLDPSKKDGPSGRDPDLFFDNEEDDTAAGQDYYTQIVHNALDAYEEALALADEKLTPTDALKVQCALKASIALYDLTAMHFDALAVAKKCLLKAERYAAISNAGYTQEEIEVMTILRDHVAMLETALSFAVVSSAADDKNKTTTTGRRMASMGSIADEENDDKNDSHLASGYIDSLRNRGRNNLKHNSGAMLSLSHRVEKIKRLSRLDGPKDCLQVGQLNHVQQVMAELSKIFRVYVRGNALAASTLSGTSVTVDGHKLDMDAFLLDGPYMSWDGFLFFCHDFRITPRKDGRGNRKLNTRAGESYLLPDNYDAQVIFTMSSIAQGPILRVEAATASEQQQQQGPPSWSSTARELWSDSGALASAAVSPTAGLNFARFVDCLARIALVGFSVGTWSEMFPTSMERINALFLTQMGMLDNAVISANLHQHKQSQGVHRTVFEGMSKLTRQSSGTGEGLKLSRQSSYGSGLARGHSQKRLDLAAAAAGGGGGDDGADGGGASRRGSATTEGLRRRSASAPVLDTLMT